MATMFALCVMMTFGCTNQLKDERIQNGMSGDQLLELKLKGSVWKLAGIVDSDKGVLKELAPKDCDDCYTLWFDTDHNVTMISISDRLKLDLLNLNPVEEIAKVLKCVEYDKDGKDYCDVTDFENSIIQTGSFLVEDDELKFFQHFRNGDGKEVISSLYLLFKRIERDSPTTLRGTEWKLSGIVDAQTNVITELEPKSCDECYTLKFRGDSVLIVRSIYARGALDLSNLDIVRDPARPEYHYNPDPLYTETWSKDGKDKTVYEDSWLYRCGIAYTKSYKLTPGELKLFFVYQDKNYYLTFKSVLQ